MQTRYRGTAILFACLALLATSATAGNWNFFDGKFGSGQKGSGKLETEERTVEPFTSIDMSIGADLIITIGSPQKLTVTIDDNLLDNIRTRVRGKTLEIESHGSFSTKKNCVIEITVPSLEEIDISGSGEITLKDLDAKEFTFDMSGSGSFEATGKVEQLFIELSGSGEIDTRDLMAQDVEVDISGSGSAVVYAANSLDGDITGSGNIRYINEPEHVSTRVTGSGSIDRAKR
jgi:hypothetical protein